MALTAEREQMGGAVICRLRGDLDAATTPAFREFSAGLADQPRLVLDLRAVPFIDSAGLGALVASVRRARSLGGDMVICAKAGPVRRVLGATGFDRLVPVGSDVDECLTLLGGVEETPACR